LHLEAGLKVISELHIYTVLRNGDFWEKRNDFWENGHEIFPKVVDIFREIITVRENAYSCTLGCMNMHWQKHQVQVVQHKNAFERVVFFAVEPFLNDLHSLPRSDMSSCR